MRLADEIGMNRVLADRRATGMPMHDSSFFLGSALDPEINARDAAYKKRLGLTFA
jgi:hypothetical protein